MNDEYSMGSMDLRIKMEVRKLAMIMWMIERKFIANGSSKACHDHMIDRMKIHYVIDLIMTTMRYDTIKELAILR